IAPSLEMMDENARFGRPVPHRHFNAEVVEMKYPSCLAPLAVALCCAAACRAGDPAKAPGNTVELGKLKSVAPSEWKAEKPANNLRSHQFRLAHPKGEAEAAELAVLPDAMGPPAAALERWKEMFMPPDGKTLEDIAKVETFKVGKASVTYLDIRGTYLQLPPPPAPQKDAKPGPDFRMLSVFFQMPEGAFTLRLIGPAATVEHHKAAFDAWVKNFQ